MLLWILPAVLADTVTGAGLSSETVIFAHILDLGGGEEIYFFGDGGGESIEIRDDKGTVVSTLDRFTEASGTLAPGTYEIQAPKGLAPEWEILVRVTGSNPLAGRIYSLEWVLTDTDNINHKFYIPVPTYGGASTYTWVVAETTGFTNGDPKEPISIMANQFGGSDPLFTSLPSSDFTSSGTELELYLSSPSAENPSSGQSLSSVQLEFDSAVCSDTVVPGYSDLKVTVTTALPGTTVFGCDTNGSGELDISGFDDLFRFSTNETGTDQLDWDGGDGSGTALPHGAYDCVVGVMNGSVALNVHNADSGSPGVRLFEYQPLLYQLDSVHQHWNDSRVIEAAGQDVETVSVLPYTEGEDGIESGNPNAKSQQNENAHAWDGWGADAWIVTWTARDVLFDVPFTVDVADVETDGDADGLADGIEQCVCQTPDDDPDADDDTLLDGEEITDPSNPRDLDKDGFIDALDPDDDGDDIATAAEVDDGNVFGDDVDKDGFPNWYDTDSDGDGIADSQEPDDSDGNGTPDYLEASSADTGETNGVDTGTVDDDPETSPGLLTGGGCAGGQAWLLGLGGLLLGRSRRLRQSSST